MARIGNGSNLHRGDSLECMQCIFTLSSVSDFDKYRKMMAKNQGYYRLRRGLESGEKWFDVYKYAPCGNFDCERGFSIQTLNFRVQS